MKRPWELAVLSGRCCAPRGSCSTCTQVSLFFHDGLDDLPAEDDDGSPVPFGLLLKIREGHLVVGLLHDAGRQDRGAPGQDEGKDDGKDDRSRHEGTPGRTVNELERMDHSKTSPTEEQT